VVWPASGEPILTGGSDLLVFVYDGTTIRGTHAASWTS